LVPVSVTVALPMSSRLPEPLISPAKVMLSERLKARTPLSTTLPVIEPVVPPLPICRVPALMVVPPA
jgi:hypothetical protein